MKSSPTKIHMNFIYCPTCPRMKSTFLFTKSIMDWFYRLMLTRPLYMSWVRSSSHLCSDCPASTLTLGSFTPPFSCTDPCDHIDSGFLLCLYQPSGMNTPPSPWSVPPKNSPSDGLSPGRQNSINLSMVMDHGSCTDHVRQLNHATHASIPLFSQVSSKWNLSST